MKVKALEKASKWTLSLSNLQSLFKFLRSSSSLITFCSGTVSTLTCVYGWIISLLRSQLFGLNDSRLNLQPF